MTKFCPPFLCTVPPVINHRVYGSGRLFQPWPLAAQAPGYAYIYGDQNPAVPMAGCAPCGPAPGMVPQAPDGYGTTVVGAGVLSPVRWRGNGIMADNYALPGDIAREPNEGWWASETVDADTGQRSWITGMSGLGRLGAFSLPSWFNNTFITVAGVRIPNWLGWGALAFVAYKIAKKRGWVKNARRTGGRRRAKRSELLQAASDALTWHSSSPSRQYEERAMREAQARFAAAEKPAKNARRRRNATGTFDQHAAHELELYIENDGDLYRQMRTPIIKNLATKVARGQYDHAKAVKGFMYLVDEGAKRYCGESHWVRTGKGNCSTPWHVMFNTPTRRAVAESFTKSFEVENSLGNYKHLLPKKYQKNRRRNRSR